MAINNTTIAHIRLTVTDITRSREFYESVFNWPINLEMPEDAEHLLQLLYSLVMASFPEEAWRQPHVPDSGAAYLDLVIEPIP